MLIYYLRKLSLYVYGIEQMFGHIGVQWLVHGTNDWICEKSVESANSADPCDALRALADLLRRTSDQLVHSRKQKLEDRRLVRLSVAED